MMNAESPSAELPPSKWIASNRSAFAIWDAFPVTTGHALIISRRPIADWWEATPGELTPRPESQFVCFAHDAALEDSPSPVRRGDPLLFERFSGSSDDDFIGGPVLMQTQTSAGTENHLMVPNSRNGKRVARLVSRLSQTDINPLAMRIRETFKRADVPVLYDFQFNQGNWSSGHVSLPNHTILFVLVCHSAEATGCDPPRRPLRES
jgi:hypothetical protein